LFSTNIWTQPIKQHRDPYNSQNPESLNLPSYPY
jgi:hypothetical protein